MAGDGEAGHIYVLLLFITVFMRLAFIRRKSRFQQRLRLLTIRSKMRRTDACFLQFPGGGGGLPYETDGDARRLA